VPLAVRERLLTELQAARSRLDLATVERVEAELRALTGPGRRDPAGPSSPREFGHTERAEQAMRSVVQTNTF